MKIIKYILIGILTLYFCIASILVYGQESELTKFYSDSLYFESPALFECKIQLPENYNKDKSYPLVISLHGGGGSYLTFLNIWKNFNTPKFIMATPQAPYKWLMGDKIGYDWSGWPEEENVRSANKLRVFIAHGKSDEIIDIDIAYKSKDIYKKYGYNTTLYEFEGGHNIDEGAMMKIEEWIIKKL
jgi:predicted esterase